MGREGGCRGGEWARCRFAFLLMHTARPPALSSFYRVSPAHLHPVMAVLYMPFVFSFRMYAGAPACRRLFYWECAFDPES